MTFPWSAGSGGWWCLAVAGGGCRAPGGLAWTGLGSARRPHAALPVSARAAAADAKPGPRLAAVSRGEAGAFGPAAAGRAGTEPYRPRGTGGGSTLWQPSRGAAATGPGRGLRYAERLLGCAAPAPRERSSGAPWRT